MARLTRCKTIGSDRALTMRLVVISKSAFVQSPSWMATGWELLRQQAAFDRDYLLPSPTDGFRGCRRKEVKYVIGSAVQFRAAALGYRKADRDREAAGSRRDVCGSCELGPFGRIRDSGECS